ncbi:MAG: SDR family oxidoreductase [Eubacterium sp.]|nr:SDR family oxidoreductase [Eubacterium sp.]
MFELTGKVAIVTGAAAGLGQGIAETFAKQGAKVVVTDRPGVSLDETIAMCKAAGADDVYDHEMDVTIKASVDKAVADIMETYGRIDILASNAGMNRSMPFEEVTEDVWDAIMNVNLKGSYLVAQAVAPVMKAQNYGRIIFTSSQASIVARGDNEAYCASKAGINALARTMAYDYAACGVTVNTVAPCFARTALTKTRLEDPAYSKMVLDMIPIGRVLEPCEVGAAFAYLASDEAAMVTGQTLVIDGGWTMV